MHSISFTGVRTAGIVIFLTLAIFVFGISNNTFHVLRELHKFDKYQECQCSVMGVTEIECGFIRNKSSILHDSFYPPGLRVAPCLLTNMWIIEKVPVFSIILTVHNQDAVISETVRHIIDLTTESYELIVVFDDCKDDSINKVLDSVSGDLPDNLFHIMLIRQDTPVFETTANNIGMRASIGLYWMLIQDDMDVIYRGWNSAAASVLRIYNDVYAVSMRASHAMYSYNTIGFGEYVGIDSERENCTLYVRDSVNRGPLLLRAHMTIELGYLDERSFYLGYDDHDLMARAYVTQGWVCGFFYIPSNIGRVAGNTRKNQNRTSNENKYIELRKHHPESFLKNITGKKWLKNHDHQRVIPPLYGCGNKMDWYLESILVNRDASAYPKVHQRRSSIIHAQE
jgi:glycosyltransferase involved in cell wall biosynthesis